MTENQASNVTKTLWQRISYRWERWYWKRLGVPIEFIFFHTSIRSDAHKTNLMNGLHDAFWCYLCGGNVTYSLKIGNIWWKNPLLPNYMDDYPHWKCRYCGRLNHSIRIACAHCGAAHD
jgi:hypothetical protein